MHLRMLIVLALCALMGQPMQAPAEPVDSLAVEAEHQAATPQKRKPQEITIYIRGEHKAVVAALVDAVDEETTITGIADFDALSATYGLMGIYRTGRMSPFYGYRFRLMFPPGVDVAAIAGTYWNLPYIQSIKYKPQDESGASLMVKERRHPFDIENAGLRLLAKVAAGTASGAVFTVISSNAIAKEANRPTMGGHFLGGLAIGSSVGFPLGVSLVDSYNSLPKTLLAGVISGVAGYFLLIAGQESDVSTFLFVPVISSLYASELSRKPPQDRRVSFALSFTPDGGLSAVSTLCF